MVSFFGLKFKGDKKKAQQDNKVKQNGAKSLVAPWDEDLPPTMNRPGTSNSAKGPTNWRTTFKGLGANASMVDLTAQRKPSVSSMQHYPPDMHMIAPWTNSSSHLPLPGAGSRVGLPDRPSTSSARSKEWINPLDVHFCKDIGNSSLRPSQDGMPKSPLSPTDITTRKSTSGDKLSLRKVPSHQTSNMTNGYPSPPASVINGDMGLSPIMDSTSGKTTSPAVPSSIPSPATSAARSSEDRWEAPVVRNVLARRDTTTFLAPRRCSFTMDIEAKPEELQKMKKQQQTEGFAGNFADFDFGESVRRQTTIDFPIPDSMANKSELREDFKFPSLDMFESKKEESAKADRIGDESPILQKLELFQLPPLQAVPKTTEAPVRPATSYGTSSRSSKPPAAAAGAHRGNFMGSLDLATPPGFQSRFDIDDGSRPKIAPPRPIRPDMSLNTLNTDTRSPLESTFSPKSFASEERPRPSFDRAPASPYTQSPMEGAFPLTKGLPRGRQPPRRPPRSDEVSGQNLDTNKPDFSLPNWSGFDKSEPRRSAMPAPLAPASPSRQPRPSTSSAATTATAPRIPSPTFTTLDISLSDATDSLALAFEEAFEKSSGGSDAFKSDFFLTERSPNTHLPMGNSTRIEAKKAPPRPAPVTLPPAPHKGPGPAIRSPVLASSEFQAGFI